jgi:hypothetical protein
MFFRKKVLVSSWFMDLACACCSFFRFLSRWMRVRVGRSELSGHIVLASRPSSVVDPTKASHFSRNNKLLTSVSDVWNMPISTTGLGLMIIVMVTCMKLSAITIDGFLLLGVS